MSQTISLPTTGSAPPPVSEVAPAAIDPEPTPPELREPGKGLLPRKRTAFAIRWWKRRVDYLGNAAQWFGSISSFSALIVGVIVLAPALDNLRLKQENSSLTKEIGESAEKLKKLDEAKEQAKADADRHQNRVTELTKSIAPLENRTRTIEAENERLGIANKQISEDLALKIREMRQANRNLELERSKVEAAKMEAQRFEAAQTAAELSLKRLQSETKRISLDKENYLKATRGRDTILTFMLLTKGL